MAIVRGLARVHDLLSRAGFVLAALVLAFISSAYCYEVISRYFFNAPTVWASPLVSYGLCMTIFLALPDLTRRAMHVSVDLHEGMLSPRLGALLLRATRLVSGIACLFGAWFTAAQTWSEFKADVLTNTYLPIPKWWLFILIPYGLLSGGVYFLRQAFGRSEAPPESTLAP